MPTAAKKSLPAKLAEIMGKLAHVEKKGFNAAQNYPFVRESDVAGAASTLFAEYNVFVAQSLSGDTRLTPLYKTRSGAEMFLTELIMEFTFYDGDSDAVIGPLRFPGAGADTGDKGVYKAMTGSEKYFLMKTFLIATGDDPEADEKVDKAAAAAGAARGGKRVRPSAQPAVDRGGKTPSATEAQVNEIARIVRDKQIDPVNRLVPLIIEVTGKPEPEEEVRLRDWLGTFTGKELAEVISALTMSDVDASVDDLGEEPPPPGDEGEQGAFDIV